ncbi:MAG: hypothetical protein QHH14_06620 [Clostridiales bacterium]|nr:hypothetical protein [Clostridiales bacterium]
MQNERQNKAEGLSVPGLSAADAMVIALRDEDTACFLRTHFAAPELKHEVLSRRWVTEHDSRKTWQVAIIEKGRLGGGREQVLNIAHISLDALSGEICQKWFFGNVFLEEYLEFIDCLSARRSDCTGRRK